MNSYSSYRYSRPPGQMALGSALIGLPRHRLDEGKPNYVAALVDKFAAAVPDEVLLAVGEEIREMTYEGELRQQPRYNQLADMVAATQAMHTALAALNDGSGNLNGNLNHTGNGKPRRRRGDRV